jgi:hypothetical protein
MERARVIAREKRSRAARGGAEIQAAVALILCAALGADQMSKVREHEEKLSVVDAADPVRKRGARIAQGQGIRGWTESGPWEWQQYTKSVYACRLDAS